MSELPYSTIRVGGADAFAFLQAQLAADIGRLHEHGLAAWCNPKGRVICLARVSRDGDAFRLAVPDELADGVLKRLTVFRFRAKVEFDLEAASGDELGVTSTYEDWRLANLRAGIVEIGVEQAEKWTPHMLNLDLLGAVSVDKGCYPGQEIIARTHFRGRTRRRCLRFECQHPVAVGDRVSDGETDVGKVINAIGGDLLAVLPLDKKELELTIHGNTLVNCPLPYCQ